MFDSNGNVFNAKCMAFTLSRIDIETIPRVHSTKFRICGNYVGFKSSWQWVTQLKCLYVHWQLDADSLRAISSHKRIKIIIGRLCRTARTKFQSAPNDGPFAVVTATNGFPASTAKILAVSFPSSTPFNQDITTWDYARLRATVDDL